MPLTKAKKDKSLQKISILRDKPDRSSNSTSVFEGSSRQSASESYKATLFSRVETSDPKQLHAPYQPAAIAAQQLEIRSGVVNKISSANSDSTLTKDAIKLPQMNADELVCIYFLHCLCDASLLSYKTLKYFFENFTSQGNANKAIHEWVRNPTGFVLGLSEFLILYGLSLVSNAGKNASKKDDTDNSFIKNQIIAFWPYLRTSIMELSKNSRNGRNLIYVATIFKENGLSQFITPVGLVLGGFSVISRCWLQQIQGQRKKFHQDMEKIEQELSLLQDTFGKIDSLLESEGKQLYKQLQEIHKKIPSISKFNNKYCYLLAAYSGIMTSLKYHATALLLIAATNPAFIVQTAIFCAVISLITIAVQVYSEYQQKCNLELNTVKLDLMIKQKQLDLINTKQLNASKREIRALEKDLDLIEKSLTALMPSAAEKLLKMVKSSLDSYTIVNVISTSLAIFLTGGVSSTIVIANMVVGSALLLGFSLYACLEHFCNNQQNNLENKPNEIITLPEKMDNLQQIQAKMTLPKDKSYLDILDIFNSFCLGLTKGKKMILYPLLVCTLENLHIKNLENKDIAFGLSLALSVLTALVHSIRTYLHNSSKSSSAISQNIEQGFLARQSRAFKSDFDEAFVTKSGDFQFYSTYFSDSRNTNTQSSSTPGESSSEGTELAAYHP